MNSARAQRPEELIASPHLLFPGLGRLHKEGKGYSWAPVALTDQWVEK